MARWPQLTPETLAGMTPVEREMYVLVNEYLERREAGLAEIAALR